MLEVAQEAFLDSVLMLPWLFGIYLVVALFERRVGHGMRHRLADTHHLGPVMGMVVGLLPQCGFSVVSAALYSQRLITVGTLTAVMLATSDEAVPIILSRPEHLGMLIPVILGKVIIAVLGGYAVDFIFRKSRFAPESCGHDHQHTEAVGCCHHDVPGDTRKWSTLVHPLKHTLSVFFFAFAISLVLGLLLHHLGEERLGELLLRGSLLQPFIVGLVGLVPNCAVSVAITQAFLDGHVGFGAAMAGLSSSGGLGLLVLVRESHRPKDVLRVVFALYGISVLAGSVIQLVWS